jgi:hypothetical protein
MKQKTVSMLEIFKDKLSPRSSKHLSGDDLSNNLTQKQRVKLHLLNEGSITSWEAIKEYGCTRLSSVIHDLRHNENMSIMSVPTTATNRYGHKVTFSNYVLDKQRVLF